MADPKRDALPASKPMFGPRKPRKTFVLLFDGTGNKFSGTEADSNILKILRMLDRSDSSQLHYYQPGIGTYVHSNTYSHTSVFTRFNSWLQKARDSAIGTSFDVHVMGGYKFLMKYYTSGDDIFFFGFSRGAYIARFLAEMLDYVGLLEPGNEEMARFAWKAFAQWQMRLDGTKEEEEKKRKMFKYLQAFRDTFSRPVRRIRFLGLFDTVNSVPRFENAWMQRSRFPYTAKSSAIVIRHAVGIDERRAKFRQDLISGSRKPRASGEEVTRGRPENQKIEEALHIHHDKVKPHDETVPSNQRYRRKHHHHHRSRSHGDGRPSTRGRSSTPPRTGGNPPADAHSILTSSSVLSLPPPRKAGEDESSDDEDDADEMIPQDIQEMWFPGCHADIGGGWPPAPGEKLPLSHVPLVWMVREARRAGLNFDEDKMFEMHCLDPDTDETEYWTERFVDAAQSQAAQGEVPSFKVDGPTPDEKVEHTDFLDDATAAVATSSTVAEAELERQRNKLHEAIHEAATNGVMHDCLEYGQGLPGFSVASWKFMEYLPFRRMDLMPDNSWRSIRWPLPKGETRDIPSDAVIHTSALRRMEANTAYRPGNLIVGGGGRGVKRAPTEFGMGEWDVHREEHDPVGACVVRRHKPGISRANTSEITAAAAVHANGNGKEKEIESGAVAELPAERPSGLTVGNGKAKS